MGGSDCDFLDLVLTFFIIVLVWQLFFGCDEDE